MFDEPFDIEQPFAGFDQGQETTEEAKRNEPATDNPQGSGTENGDFVKIQEEVERLKKENEELKRGNMRQDDYTRGKQDLSLQREALRKAHENMQGNAIDQEEIQRLIEESVSKKIQPVLEREMERTINNELQDLGKVIPQQVKHFLGLRNQLKNGKINAEQFSQKLQKENPLILKVLNNNTQHAKYAEKARRQGIPVPEKTLVQSFYEEAGPDLIHQVTEMKKNPSKSHWNTTRETAQRSKEPVGNSLEEASVIARQNFLKKYGGL